MAFYRIELYKNWGTRALKGRWSNTYEAQAASLTVVRDEIIPNLIIGEKAIHLANVQFLSGVISAYRDGLGTLDPAQRLPFSMLGTGLRDSGGGQPYDIEMAWQSKLLSFGRAFGKKAYHGCLTELDMVSGSDGKATLDPASSLYSGGVSTNTYVEALQLSMSPEPADPRLGMYTRFQTSPRGAIPKVYGPWAFYPASEVNFLKTGNVKMDHGWFNRTG